MDEARYETKLDELPNWSREERACLEKLLARFSPSDRIKHLDVLQNTPKRNIRYPSTTGPSWFDDVELFMDGRHKQRNLSLKVGKLMVKNIEITEQMRRNGWCPSTIQLLRHAFHVPGLHLAMLFWPPTTDDERKLTHKNCSATQCNALQVNDGTHKSSHTQGSCVIRQCKRIEIDKSEVDRIIQHQNSTRRIPRIVIPLEGELPSKLKVQDDGLFIAVSHVWAHGIGNSDNTMPVCQLDRIRGFLKEIEILSIIPSLVWMDTFCVPTGDQFSGSRRKAISQIAEIFHRAARILVLDSALLQTTSKASPTELCMRILASDWMRRLWTLEEAMLACSNARNNKLIFRFQDGQVTLEKLLEDLRKEKSPYARSAIYAIQKHLTLRPVKDHQRFYPSRDSVASQFAQIAKAIKYRNTSKEGDEMICMASILKLPSERILAGTTTEEKTKAFLLTLKYLPLSILFCNGLRMPSLPFRWALRSFLTTDNPRKVDALSRFNTHLDRSVGRCEPDGLHIQCSGILFKLKSARGSEFNRISIKQENLSLEPPEWELSVQPPESQSWSRLLKCTHSDQLVLIINPSCNYEAVVLRKINQDKGVYHAEFLCQVHIWRHRRRALIDVGPIRKEETTGYYRLFAYENQDGKSSRNTNTRKAARARRKKGTGEFFRGDDDSQGHLPRKDKKLVHAKLVFRTKDDQRWLIT